MDMMDLVRNGIKIIDGILCNRYGSTISGCIRVKEFGWGSPCTEYHFDDYAYNDYSIKQDSYGAWHLMHGYTEVCRLNYYGGKNWSSI